MNEYHREQEKVLRHQHEKVAATKPFLTLPLDNLRAPTKVKKDEKANNGEEIS